MAVALRHRKRTASRVTGRQRRAIRGRKRVFGTAERPRLVVTRSSRHIVAQVVDDVEHRTLVSASSMEADVRSLSGDKTAKAKKVGELAMITSAGPRRGRPNMTEVTMKVRWLSDLRTKPSLGVA